MKIKLTEKYWAEKFKAQSNRITAWINQGADINKNYTEGEKNPKKNLFDEYLRGTDIAGIGQGKFSNNAKDNVNNGWKEISELLKKVKNAKVPNQENQQTDNSPKEDNNKNKELFKGYESLFNLCKNLQEILIKCCKKSKKEGEETKEVEEHKPWAAIHAMIVALRPEVFCSIVTERNIDELYKKLSEEAESEETKSEEAEPEEAESEIDLKFGNEWNELKNAWKEANSKKMMSWYYKSVAIQNYFKAIVGKPQNDWFYQNYPWTTLLALRGEENIRMMAKKLEKQRNLILTGAPGTGKTYLARKIAKTVIGVKEIKDLNNNKRYDFVQFHPSYDYTDFVEGLRPIQVGDNVVFERKDGIFKAFCKTAAQDNDPKHKYVFFIDEINRGEISKIFGELFFSIDPGYRGEVDKDGISNRVKTQYQNLIEKKNVSRQDQGVNKSAKEIFKEDYSTGFYVPDNVFVIATMNDIDRSVESMDFAFRRRFAFHEVTAEDSASIIYSADEKKGWDADKKQTAVDRMNSMNKAIIKKCGLPAQYQIGGAYFLKLEDVYFDYKKLWSDYIKGTLYEYFRGLPAKEIDEKLKLIEDAYNNGNEDDD